MDSLQRLNNALLKLQKDQSKQSFKAGLARTSAQLKRLEDSVVEQFDELMQKKEDEGVMFGVKWGEREVQRTERQGPDFKPETTRDVYAKEINKVLQDAIGTIIRTQPTRSEATKYATLMSAEELDALEVFYTPAILTMNGIEDRLIAIHVPKTAGDFKDAAIIPIDTRRNVKTVHDSVPAGTQVGLVFRRFDAIPTLSNPTMVTFMVPSVAEGKEGDISPRLVRLARDSSQKQAFAVAKRLQDTFDQRRVVATEAFEASRRKKEREDARKKALDTIEAEYERIRKSGEWLGIRWSETKHLNLKVSKVNKRIAQIKKDDVIIGGKLSDNIINKDDLSKMLPMIVPGTNNIAIAVQRGKSREKIENIHFLTDKVTEDVVKTVGQDKINAMSELLVSEKAENFEEARDIVFEGTQPDVQGEDEEESTSFRDRFSAFFEAFQDASEIAQFGATVDELVSDTGVDPEQTASGPSPANRLVRFLRTFGAGGCTFKVNDTTRMQITTRNVNSKHEELKQLGRENNLNEFGMRLLNLLNTDKANFVKLMEDSSRDCEVGDNSIKTAIEEIQIEVSESDEGESFGPTRQPVSASDSDESDASPSDIDSDEDENEDCSIKIADDAAEQPINNEEQMINLVRILRTIKYKDLNITGKKLKNAFENERTKQLLLLQIKNRVKCKNLKMFIERLDTPSQQQPDDADGQSARTATASAAEAAAAAEQAAAEAAQTCKLQVFNGSAPIEVKTKEDLRNLMESAVLKANDDLAHPLGIAMNFAHKYKEHAVTNPVFALVTGNGPIDCEEVKRVLTEYYNVLKAAAAERNQRLQAERARAAAEAEAKRAAAAAAEPAAKEAAAAEAAAEEAAAAEAAAAEAAAAEAAAEEAAAAEAAAAAAAEEISEVCTIQLVNGGVNEVIKSEDDLMNLLEKIKEKEFNDLTLAGKGLKFLKGFVDTFGQDDNLDEIKRIMQKDNFSCQELKEKLEAIAGEGLTP
jgi:hypothetical protein